MLLIAGDLCPTINHKPQFQRKWVMGSFYNWIDTMRKERGIPVIGICGNHDFVGEHKADCLRQVPWNYLDDDFYFHRNPNLNIYGCPHTKQVGDWAFGMSPEELAKHHSQIPKETHILITHGPPLGYGDKAPRNNNEQGFENCGSPALLKWIEEVQPKLVVYGHIHEDDGIWQIGKTIVANVSFLDGRYQPKGQPRVIELEV
jgi:Icc-related predicted phosphoesterase